MAFASSGTRDFVACNHLRSYKYYSSSILNPDGFLGYPCASYNEFQEVGHTSRGKMSVALWVMGDLFLWLGREHSCNLMTDGRRDRTTEPHRDFSQKQGRQEGT